MIPNTSSKICISKRLAITSLLLIAIGFSVVVFSTLSSSVNKTTSSKAEAPESVALRDFGGKNMPCKYDPNHNPNYYCNADTTLVCDGSLDFWLSNDETKFHLWKENKGQGPKCIDPADVPMGKVGQLCRKEGQRLPQCDSGVCAKMFDEAGHVTKANYDYIEFTYKGNKRTDLVFSLNSDGTIFKKETDVNALYHAIRSFTHANADTPRPYLVNPPSICIPESLSKVESCGDAGQKTCKNELGQDFCFGENRVVISGGTYKCAAKNTITNRGQVRCDNGSTSCNEFCTYQGAKCVETCEDKALATSGNESREVIIKAGLFEQELGDSEKYTGQRILQPKNSGTCSQTFAPSYGLEKKLSEVCSLTYNTYCCCDKIK